MKPYSMDLRQRIVAAVDAHEGPIRQLARRFRVSPSCITRLLALRRQTGSLQPRPHAGGSPPLLGQDQLQHLRQLLQQQPDAILAELAQQLGCSIMTVWRALRRLKLTRKKKVFYADQREDPEVLRQRQQVQQQCAQIDPERLVFIDETGATTAMARLYGRCPRGERVYGRVPGSWDSMTLITGMRLSGVVAPFAFEGATDAQAMKTYVANVLGPQLKADDVVIWDNLKPHKDPEVVRLLQAKGVAVLPNAPWSPDLMPIEKLFSKVKGILRTLAARTKATLAEAMGKALQGVSGSDIVGWFQSCGLAMDRIRQRTKGLLHRLRSRDCAQLACEAL